MPVTVISRLALGRWIFVAVVVALAAGALFWTAFHPESGASYDPNGPVASIGAARVGGFLGGVACLLGFAYCLYLPISSRGRAVWIEGSELVFVDDFGRHRVPLAEIERTELGTDSANASGVPIVFGVIELYRRDGDKDRIRTSIMAEEKETVLARLQEVLENRQGSRQESRAL